MTYKAYLDNGYGFFKGTDSNNNTILRSSLYSEIPTHTNGTELGIESSFGHYLMGDSAANASSMPLRFQNYEDCLSDAYAASCLLGIAEMNGSLQVDCELVLSLPYEAMYLAQDLMNRLTGTHTIKRLGYRTQKINIHFPKRFGIVSQNVAPVFVKFGKINKAGQLWFANANVGSKTFEQGTFGLDMDNFRIIPGTKAQQDTKQKGTYTLANEAEPLLLEYFRGQLTNFTQHEIFNILVTGKVSLGSQDINVNEIIQPAKQRYLDAIVAYCLELWSEQNGRELLKMYQLTLSGGGAYIVAPYLRKVKVFKGMQGIHNNIMVSDKPQFDVVIGSKRLHELIGG